MASAEFRVTDPRAPRLAVQQDIRQAAQRVAARAAAGSPRRTGRLAAGWEVRPGYSDPGTSVVVNTVPYARFVEYGTRHPPGPLNAGPRPGLRGRMMTVPVIVQPDLEAWVWSNISDLGGVTSFSYSAVQQWPGWVMAHFIQVDARQVRKDQARALAERVRQIICGLPGVPWPDGAICYVQPVEGPFWLPDDDGSPRYTARYEIRVHPPRSATALVPAAGM